MTLRKIAMIAGIIPVLAGIFACNSEYEYTTVTVSSTAVKSFSLSSDDSILANLDSVYFSIDLNKGLIFNADSLPYGTNITKLIPKITTLETASKIELNVKRSNGTDTTYNYLSNSTDSIDFTNPVRLRVVSHDGLNEFYYTVNVNVHKMISDSLTWKKENSTALPTDLTNPTCQRTVESESKFYCLTSDGAEYCMATYSRNDKITNGPVMEISDWETESVSFPFTPNVESFAASNGTFYILSDNGTLYISSDAASWTATDIKWNYIYGRYGDEIIGSFKDSDKWYIQSYPSNNITELPSGMPVEGSSCPISYTFPMSGSEQMVIVGGRCADGSLTNNTWAFDGQTWVKLSVRPLPVALEGVAVASYFSFGTSSSWNVTTYPTLIAFGGKDANGKTSSKVYMSNDYGVNWKEAPKEMQLPDYFPALYNAQTFVADSYYSTNIQPKIARPTETWSCPYIYMFGGYLSTGKFQNALWRGVLNRMSFAPIE